MIRITRLINCCQNYVNLFWIKWNTRSAPVSCNFWTATICNILLEPLTKIVIYDILSYIQQVNTIFPNSHSSFSDKTKCTFSNTNQMFYLWNAAIRTTTKITNVARFMLKHARSNVITFGRNITTGQFSNEGGLLKYVFWKVEVSYSCSWQPIQHSFSIFRSSSNLCQVSELIAHAVLTTHRTSLSSSVLLF